MTTEIMDLYLNKQEVFEHFILYFRDKAINRIKLNNFKEGLLPSCISPFASELPDDVNFHDYLDKVSIKNYHLRVQEQDIALSQREMDCLRLLAQGRAVKEIARTYNISTRSVETYISRIKDKTSCTTRGQLITLYNNAYYAH
jgi:DNA-binding CsgD family transcriptional regulator